MKDRSLLLQVLIYIHICAVSIQKHFSVNNEGPDQPVLLCNLTEGKLTSLMYRSGPMFPCALTLKMPITTVANNNL